MGNPVSFRQKLNISQASGLFVALMILITGLIISGLTYNQQRSHGLASIKLQTQLQLQRLSLALAPSLLRQDRVSLNLTLNEWQKGQEIRAIRILNTDREVLAETGRFLNSLELITQTITQDNLAIGLLQASIDDSAAENDARRYFSFSLLASALIALIGALITYQLADRLFLYLRRLPGKLTSWQQGETLELEEPALSDFSELHNCLIEISTQEQQRRAVEQALQQFICDDNNNPSDNYRYQDCAMLYIEIQELEVLQSRLTANELSILLNQYHKLLNQAAKLYNGKLDRFQGDGIVMLFGLPKNDEQDARHCLYAAQLFLGLIAHIRESDSKILPLEFKIAAHHGPVLLAPVGDDSHIQGSLIGDTIHWSAQLAQSGEEDRLLVSQQLLNHIENSDEIDWQSGPLVNDLHGKEEPSYWLNTLPEKNQSLIQRQIKHITAMTEQA